MRRLAGGRVGVAFLLVTVLVTALGLRAWGSGFGLPAYTRYHPDEHALVDRAASILWTGEWNLHRFNYPSLYAYMQTGAYATFFLWGAAQGRWDQVPSFTLPQYYQVGRLLTSILGTLTVLVVFLVGRQLRGRCTGLLAATLLGGCYLHIIHSHYATFDVVVGLLAATTLLFTVLLTEHQSLHWYFLAGLFAGLTGATKYNGAVVVVLPLLAHILVTPWGEWGWLDRRLFAGAGGFLLGFFGGNPFALGSLPEFLTGLATVLHHYGTEQPGFEGSGNWRWYLRVFLASADGPLVAVGGLGIVGWVAREWRKGILLAVFPATYFMMISSFVVRFERNLVPLLPFLALGGAWLVETVANWIACRLDRGRGLSHGLAILSVILLLVLPTIAAVTFDRAISQTDLRETAGQWVEANIEAGAKIAIEHYSIPFDHLAYQVKDVLRISDHNLAWYVEEGYDVLIVSDGVWELLLRRPSLYAKKVAVYRELLANSRLLAEFVPQPPSLVVAGYPTVAIYHFAPVRIYALPK